MSAGCKRRSAGPQGVASLPGASSADVAVVLRALCRLCGGRSSFSRSTMHSHPDAPTPPETHDPATALLIRTCRSCGVRFHLCTRCFRGHHYCTATCRLLARLSTSAKARRRWRRSDAGRARRAEQARRYRARQRARSAQNRPTVCDSVGHHSSHKIRPLDDGPSSAADGPTPGESTSLTEQTDVQAVPRVRPSTALAVADAPFALAPVVRVCARCGCASAHRLSLADHLAAREAARDARRARRRRRPRQPRGPS